MNNRQREEALALGLLQPVEQRGDVTRAGLCGASERAEIAALRALEQGIEMGCPCDPGGERTHCPALPGERPRGAQSAASGVGAAGR